MKVNLLTVLVRFWKPLIVLIFTILHFFTEWLGEGLIRPVLGDAAYAYVEDHRVLIAIICLLLVVIVYLFDGLRKQRAIIKEFQQGPIPDMAKDRVIEFFVNKVKYETITDIEFELADVAANARIQIWGMGRNGTAYLPIPPETFKDHVLVIREHALESIANLGTFGLSADQIKSGGVIIHGRKQTIAYACIRFSKKQIESTKWSDRSPKPPTPEK